VAVALTAAGACRPARLPTPLDFFDETAGVFAPDNGFNAWGILGTAALSETVPASAVAALAAQQQADGGWEWQAGFGADTNTTALAVQALLATGADPADPAVVAALDFLKSAQQPDGGFVYDPAAPEFGSDANSTAYVVQALAAAGEDAADERWTVKGVTPYAFLLSLQQPDGSFVWQAGTPANLLSTAQVIPALLGRPYPLAVRPLERCTYR
jgi:prenyltransferase beta subunit